MNFTAHRMNTGLSDIFNEISVGKLQKNDSSPQIANLARINKGDWNYNPKTSSLHLQEGLEEQKPQRGLELVIPLQLRMALCLEEQKPQRGLEP